MGKLERLYRALPRRRQRSPRVASRLAVIVAIAGVPLGASTAQPSDLASASAAAVSPLETVPLDAAPLAGEFAGIVDPLGTDLRTADLAIPQDAVDLDSFDPPLDTAPVAQSLGSGVASYYGRQFHGRPTASGERFDMRELTAAHKTLPFGTRVLVTNPQNGRSVTVRINDRGPYAHGRTIDLSRAAAEQIGLVARGHGTVELAILP
jgi:rare lipoprotein A